MKIYKPFSLNGSPNEIAATYTDVKTGGDVADMELANPDYVFELVRKNESLVKDGIENICYIYRDLFHPTSYEHTVLILQEKGSNSVKVWCGNEAKFILAAESGNGMEFCIAGLEPQQLSLYPDENSRTFELKFLDQLIVRHEFNHAMGFLDDCKTPAPSGKARIQFSIPALQTTTDYLVETIAMSESSKTALVRQQNAEFMRGNPSYAAR